MNFKKINSSCVSVECLPTPVVALGTAEPAATLSLTLCCPPGSKTLRSILAITWPFPPHLVCLRRCPRVERVNRAIRLLGGRVVSGHSYRSVPPFTYLSCFYSGKSSQCDAESQPTALFASRLTVITPTHPGHWILYISVTFKIMGSKTNYW